MSKQWQMWLLLILLGVLAGVVVYALVKAGSAKAHAVAPIINPDASVSATETQAEEAFVVPPGGTSIDVGISSIVNRQFFGPGGQPL